MFGDNAYTALTGLPFADRLGSVETTIGPELSVARTDLDAASQGLGRSLPAVIGTYRVEGVYVVGGMSTISTTTSTTTWQSQSVYSYFGIATSYGGSGSTYSYSDDVLNIYTPTTVQNVTTTTISRCVYVLAYDPFELGYDLIRLEVDGNVVFDAEHSIPASSVFRFYGGRQTVVDPILSDIIGANAGAYQNFVLLVLDGYPSGAPPSVSAVISNATTNSPGSVPIVWTGATPGVFTDPFGFGEAYDPNEGVIYDMFDNNDFAGLGAVYLVVLDVEIAQERYRLPLAGTANYYPSAQRHAIWAIRGTGHALVRLLKAGEPRVHRIYDVLTGAIVATYIEQTTEEILWSAGLEYGDEYVFIGLNRHSGEANQVFYGVANVLAGTFTVTEGDPFSMDDPATWGRHVNGKVSFYTAELSTTAVYEHTYDGTSWVRKLIYTSPDFAVQALWFDQQTGYLLITSVNTIGTQFWITYRNPVNGASIDRYEVDFLLDQNPGGGNNRGFERCFPLPGYAIFIAVATHETAMLLDIRAKTLTVFSDTDTFTPGIGLNGSIFDQTRGMWFSYYNDDIWTEHKLPGSLPGLVPLDTFIITKAMSLAGFGPGDLTFEGFSGLTDYGLGVVSDTTVQNVIKSISDVYGFTFCDTGSGFFFKKAAQGALLSIDAAFTTDDLVERPLPVQSTDEANIRTPQRVEMEYVSKEGAYKARPASFSMTTGVLNSITTPKLSTPMVMTDEEGQRIVTEKFFEFQERRRDHNFVVAPDFVEVLPGDIVTVPSGNILYTTRIEQVVIDLRTMGVEINAKDFQTAVETTITAVSNNAGTIASINFASQYLHLDMPLYRYADDEQGAALVQYGLLAPRGQLSWSGATLYRGVTATTLLALFTQAPHNGVVGFCTTVLANPLDPFALDDDSTVTIQRVTQSATLLTDKTEDEVLAGENNALIGIDGRWEWVGYKTVVDNGNGTYELSGFTLRGFRGSEVFCDRHALNDTFVLLDAAWLQKMVEPLTDLGDTLYYKAVGLGQAAALIQAKTHIITGAAETPYACVNLGANLASPDGIDLAWDYRSRIATGLNPVNFGEATLAFEIDIILPGSPTAVLRTLTSTTNFKHYTAANITTDFGGVPDTLTFDIYMMTALPLFVPGQLPAVSGRGYRARATIILSAGVMTADNSVITADSILFTADAA